MDDVGRKKVQTLVCDEIAGRTFDDANANMRAIMEKVKADATNYFASVGMTLDFIGYADTSTFDDAVQAAINRRYVASQDKEIALALEPYTATIQALAAAQALRSFGDKSDGKLPTTIVGLPTNAQELLSGLLRAPGAVTAPARAPTH
jgi:membrane protease subunit (stomatin/prohibitin family)